MPEPDQPPSDSPLASPTVNTTSPSNQPVHQEHWPLKRIPIQPALSLSFLASVLLIALALVAIAQFVVFPDTNRWAPWCVAVYRATQGLIDFTLMLGLFLQVLIIGILVIGIGRLRPRELGLDIAKLPAGVAWTFAAWLVAQLVTLGWLFVRGDYSEQAAQPPNHVVFFPTPESPLEIPSKVTDVQGDYDLLLLGEWKQLSVGCFDVIHATYTYG